MTPLKGVRLGHGDRRKRHNPSLYHLPTSVFATQPKSERYHQEATKAYQSVISQKGQIYTTDYILDETFTFFFRRLPAPRADQSMKALLSAFLADNFYLIRITEERFAQTQLLRSKFLDKPLISFTDLTSMAVMQECNITTILT